MLPDLQSGFDLVEHQRIALQNGVLALGDAQINWKPNADLWSIRQIVQHLVLSDETIGQVRDTTGETDALPFRLLPRALRRALILKALRRDVVLPLPSPDIAPQGDVPLPELLSRWNAARGEMARFLEGLRGDEPRYSHPVLGPLTATQMLELGLAHTAYHARQITALQTAPAFPSTENNGYPPAESKRENL